MQTLLRDSTQLARARTNDHLSITLARGHFHRKLEMNCLVSGWAEFPWSRASAVATGRVATDRSCKINSNIEWPLA